MIKINFDSKKFGEISDKIREDILDRIDRAVETSADNIKAHSNDKIIPVIINIGDGTKVFTNNPEEIKVDRTTKSFEKAWKEVPNLLGR